MRLNLSLIWLAGGLALIASQASAHVAIAPAPDIGGIAPVAMVAGPWLAYQLGRLRSRRKD